MRYWGNGREWPLHELAWGHDLVITTFTRLSADWTHHPTTSPLKQVLYPHTSACGWYETLHGSTCQYCLIVVGVRLCVVLHCQHLLTDGILKHMCMSLEAYACIIIESTRLLHHRVNSPASSSSQLACVIIESSCLQIVQPDSAPILCPLFLLSLFLECWLFACPQFALRASTLQSS